MYITLSIVLFLIGFYVGILFERIKQIEIETEKIDKEIEKLEKLLK